MLGFEFLTSVEPFAIYRLYSSFGICIGMALEAQLESLQAYRYYFLICFIITLASQSVMAFGFNFKNRESQLKINPVSYSI